MSCFELGGAALSARKREDAAASGLLTFECSQIIQNLSLDLPDMLGRRAIREIASELATALKTLLKYPPVPFAFHSGISLYRASKRVLARYRRVTGNGFLDLGRENIEGV